MGAGPEGGSPRGPAMTPLIATLTLNPAVDMGCHAASVRPTHKVRTTMDRLDAGGGGVNVARVLHALGCDTVALVVTGGITGHLIEELLDETHVPWRAVHVPGRTRITLNIRDASTGLEWRFVPDGPAVAPEQRAAVLALLAETGAPWVVASGSLPPGTPETFYGDLAAATAARGGKFVLDSSGPPLKAAEGRGIEVLKVSQSELEFLAGRQLPDQAQIRDAIAGLLRTGAAKTIAASLGRDGAVIASGAEMHALPALPVTVQSAVGAGDSFLAGLVAGLAGGMGLREALGWATATAAVSVSRFGTAQVDRAAVEEAYRQLTAA